MIVDDILLDELLGIVEAIVAGRIAPYNGAAAIWARMAEEEGAYPDPWRRFVGLASEWQDSPTHRDEYERDTLEFAREVLHLYRPESSRPPGH